MALRQERESGKVEIMISGAKLEHLPSNGIRDIPYFKNGQYPF